MIAALLLIACAETLDPVDAPDAWTRARIACPRGDRVIFDRKVIAPISQGTTLPDETCAEVLRDDFGIAEDQPCALTAAWSLVLWQVDAAAYDRAAYAIDEVIDGCDDGRAEAAYHDGAVCIADDFDGGHLGAAVLVHEAAHAWSPPHVRCSWDGLPSCDDTTDGAVGAQVAWLDALVVMVEQDPRTRAGAVDPVEVYIDGLAERILP